jgi:hypothetical protein
LRNIKDRSYAFNRWFENKPSLYEIQMQQLSLQSGSKHAHIFRENLFTDFCEDGDEYILQTYPGMSTNDTSANVSFRSDEYFEASGFVLAYYIEGELMVVFVFVIENDI